MSPAPPLRPAERDDRIPQRRGERGRRPGPIPTPSVVAWIARVLRGLLPRRPWPTDRGEQAAARGLRAVGWTLLAANLRVGSDEADLVLRDEAGCPVIVEVKSSAGGPMGPELQVGPWKQARLRRLALRLAHSPQGRRLFGVDRGRETVVPRIDVVTVRLAATGPRDDRIERHLLNAVEGGPTPRRRGVLR